MALDPQNKAYSSPSMVSRVFPVLAMGLRPADNAHLRQLSARTLGLYATHVQRDEIVKIRDEARRQVCWHFFGELMTVMAPTTSVAAGVSVDGVSTWKGRRSKPFTVQRAVPI